MEGTQNLKKIMLQYRNKYKKTFLPLTFFENLNFENNDILYYLFVALNHHQHVQDWYRINKMLFLSLGEQDIKITIGAGYFCFHGFT